MSMLKVDRKFWSPIVISSGLTIFFFGVSFTFVNLGVAIFDIIAGVAFLALGLHWARKF